MTALRSAPFRTVLPTVETQPIVVVGNGPVGQTVALLLARWGVPVVVLDARQARDPIGSKALCQARDVIDIWDSVGAGEAIGNEGVTWTTARTFYRQQEISRWSFVDSGRSPFPPFVNIGQQRTEQLLDERVDAAGKRIDVRWDHRVTAVTQDERQVELTVATPHGEQILSSPYVVFCSGSGSREIRHQLGLGFPGRSFTDQFLICDIKADLPGWQHERRFYFDPEWNPGRQVLIHACPGSSYRIDWQVPADYDLEAEERSGALARRIRQIVGDRPYEIIWKSVYRFHSRRAERMRVGRVLLAGDCAHIVSPFGARGLNTGVFDAENAAWKLAFQVRGWAGDGLLDSYDAERVAATVENLDVSEATMRFLVPQDDDEREARVEALEAAAADPAAAGGIDSGRFAEAFWYTDSPLTTPDPDRPFTGRPPRGATHAAGPGVVLPDLPVHWNAHAGVTRLRELARLGILLLVAPGTDAAAVLAAAGQATAAPVIVARLDELEDDGSVAAAIGAAAGEVWVVRPDAYVAAVLDGAGPGLVEAIRRSLGG